MQCHFWPVIFGHHLLFQIQFKDNFKIFSALEVDPVKGGIPRVFFHKLSCASSAVARSFAFKYTLKGSLGQWKPFMANFMLALLHCYSFIVIRWYLLMLLDTNIIIIYSLTQLMTLSPLHEPLWAVDTCSLHYRESGSYLLKTYLWTIAIFGYIHITLVCIGVTIYIMVKFKVS